jgi:hypothetical protein
MNHSGGDPQQAPWGLELPVGSAVPLQGTHSACKGHSPWPVVLFNLVVSEHSQGSVVDER